MRTAEDQRTARGRKVKAEIKRFMSYVDKSEGLGPKGTCWEWRGVVLNSGYGLFYELGGEKRQTTAHRWILEAQRGPVKKGWNVMHRCDNRLCVRLAHLWVGTQSDNMQDASKKGRLKRLQGGDSPYAKLTWEQAEEVRQLAGTMTNRQIASKFGVSDSTIGAIVNGTGYKVRE